MFSIIYLVIAGLWLRPGPGLHWQAVKALRTGGFPRGSKGQVGFLCFRHNMDLGQCPPPCKGSVIRGWLPWLLALPPMGWEDPSLFQKRLPSCLELLWWYSDCLPAELNWSISQRCPQPNPQSLWICCLRWEKELCRCNWVKALEVVRFSWIIQAAPISSHGFLQRGAGGSESRQRMWWQKQKEQCHVGSWA